MILGFDAKRFFHNKTGLGNYSRDLIRILAQYHPENSYIYLYGDGDLEKELKFIDKEYLSKFERANY